MGYVFLKLESPGAPLSGLDFLLRLIHNPFTFFFCLASLAVSNFLLLVNPAGLSSAPFSLTVLQTPLF